MWLYSRWGGITQAIWLRRQRLTNCCKQTWMCRWISSLKRNFSERCLRQSALCCGWSIGLWLTFRGFKRCYHDFEVEDKEDLNHQDLAKFIIWSSIAGEALLRARVPRDRVRVPFLIGPGRYLSLFVTEFSHVDYPFLPKVFCVFNRLDLLNQNNRRKVFVSLVLFARPLESCHCRA